MNMWENFLNQIICDLSKNPILWQRVKTHCDEAEIHNPADPNGERQSHHREDINKTPSTDGALIWDDPNETLTLTQTQKPLNLWSEEKAIKQNLNPNLKTLESSIWWESYKTIE